MANIHALSLLVASRGGFAFATPKQDPDFKVVSLVLFDGADNDPKSKNGVITPFLEFSKLGGVASSDEHRSPPQGHKPAIIDQDDYYYGLRTSPYHERFNELRNTYRAQVEDFGPDHYFLLWKSVRTKDTFPSHILAQLRLSSHDPDLFFRYKNTLLEKIHTTPYMKEVLEELRLVWENFYPNGVKNEDDVAFALGRIFFKVDEYKAALHFFEEALRTDPNDHATYYNIGLCKENMNSMDEALNNYNLCLANRPTFVRAVKRRERVLRILKGEPPDPPDEQTNGEKNDNKKKKKKKKQKKTGNVGEKKSQEKKSAEQKSSSDANNNKKEKKKTKKPKKPPSNSHEEEDREDDEDEED